MRFSVYAGMYSLELARKMPALSLVAHLFTSALYITSILTYTTGPWHLVRGFVVFWWVCIVLLSDCACEKELCPRGSTLCVQCFW